MLKHQNIIRDAGKTALRIQHIFINITLTLMLSWEDAYSRLLPGTSLCTWLLLLGLLTCVCSGLLQAWGERDCVSLLLSVREEKPTTAILF